jgi:glucose-6-phosphate 1-dehydrogenase
MNKELPAVNLVIFGISGDLSRRYILPSLASLEAEGRLPQKFKIIGLSRRDIKNSDVLEDRTELLDKYLKTVKLDMAKAADYARLNEHLPAAGQTIFYLSVPPAAVLPILKHLSEAGLNKKGTKLLLEKPFGYDLESARELVAETRRCFKEEQIYRIDHYMAKEMAQNIAVFLGSNALFRNVWSNQFVDSIEIVAAEKIGIEGRADFYESTGALRDLVQSHLMNLAALTLMRPCSTAFEFAEMPERRLEALKSLAPANPAEAFRAQYEGYRDEAGNPGSCTETFCSVTLHSTHESWQGVPIRLITGKKLNTKVTEVRIRFKKADESQANSLTLRIQPEEGVEIDLWAKKPGFEQELRHLPLTFRYADAGQRLPDAYEQVLLDAMRSRSSLFAGSDEVLETWRVLQPILDSWSKNPEDFRTYRQGSTIEQALAS